ncbi:MAG: phosphate ABC transporter ATP-binding protein, partial [Thermoprotei archaeon]
LDPINTKIIEDLIKSLNRELTIVIVTHNIQQAKRISDFTAFLHLGRLIEYGPTHAIFDNPSNELTRDYISGRFG